MSAVSQDHAVGRPIFAMGLRVVAMASFAVMFACVKLAAERGVHVFEIMFYRQAFAVPIVLATLMMGPGLASVRTPRIGTHISRSAIGLSAMALNFLSVAMLPLAEATTIGFAAPIFGTILSALVLGEATGMHRWSAVLVGFAGVILIAMPGGHMNIPLLGVAIASLGAFSSAVVAILLRQLGRTEASTTTVFWFSVLALAPLGLLMISYARPHDSTTWLLLVMVGGLGGIGQLFQTAALRHGQVSVVLPMDYTTLLWSTLAGWLIWSTLPGPATWMGATLIVASGLYILWRERRKHLAPSPVRQLDA